jgi:hypothetical protein
VSLLRRATLSLPGACGDELLLLPHVLERVLKQGTDGIPVAAICRRAGICLERFPEGD